MSNVSRADQVDSDGSIGHKLKEFFGSITGKIFSFVVFLFVFGRLLDWVAINTGLIEHSTMVSVLIGMSYSLAAVIVLVGLVVGIVISVR
ncbi:hypothetical protein [Halocatena pleomorpha]|uniref:Uncharacterized protein n=1 Tax=Halocatena pleomorpha TaxID=1785090 RepID=A0A3P3RIR0_9EURY|nr:hypothetical protein [Halocatena pleomorpha]RRJ32690.1 hypothetical protein EIK79_04335 [Halocatena pleomorpha]